MNQNVRRGAFLFEFLSTMKKKTKTLRKKEGTYKRASKKISSVDESRIARLQEKFLYGKENTRKFDSEMIKLTDYFADQFEEFITADKEIVEALESLIVLDEKQEYQDLEQVKEVLQGVLNAQNSVVMTKESIQKFRDEFSNFIKGEEEEISKDYKDDKRMRKGKKPKVGFFTRMKNERGLAKKALKLEKRLGDEEHDKDEIIEQIKLQIKDGFKQDFLYLLSQVVHDQAIIEDILSELRDSLTEMIYKNTEEYNKVMQRFTEIAKHIQGYRGYQRAYKVMKQYADTTGFQAINNFLAKDQRSQRVLGSEIKKIGFYLDPIVQKFAA